MNITRTLFKIALIATTIWVVTFLFIHIENFPENLGDVSDEQGERFHQDIKIMEGRYQGRWGKTMMADFCWCLQMETVNVQHKRKVNKRQMLP